MKLMKLKRDEFEMTLLGVGIARRQIHVRPAETLKGCVHRRFGDAKACGAKVEQGWLCTEHQLPAPRTYSCPEEELWRWWEGLKEYPIEVQEMLEEDQRAAKVLG